MLLPRHLPAPALGLPGLYGAAPGTIHRILLVALREWSLFGGRTAVYTGGSSRPPREGHKENELGYSARVGRYWKFGTGHRFDGDDRDKPWSAAFISFVMRTAGVADKDFRRAPAHAKYIHFALRNRAGNVPGAKFVGRRLAERAPRAGDLVCCSRGKVNTSYEQAVRRDDYESHCDIVLYARPGEIGVLGGNVGDSVTLKVLATDAGGHLIDRHHPWFAVLENRLPLR